MSDHSRKLSPHGHSYSVAPHLLGFKTARPPPDVTHRISREIYNYWFALLACTPDFITCVATFEYHNLDDSLSSFLDSQDFLGHEWDTGIDREYENIEARLDFEGEEEPEGLYEVTHFAHYPVELSGSGGRKRMKGYRVGPGIRFGELRGKEASMPGV
ncbi:hypothetical protein C7212DRAFT_344384 [Tuber magnatum]|uniref:Uncharacterized protein n=1 Tax=Tuber magnatum TaxID=42249 RepID=A0A317SMP0_9PEZI|nr:hypothetical protein C7212DRAFT_344384 [Tuber magnatum]